MISLKDYIIKQMNGVAYPKSSAMTIEKAIHNILLNSVVNNERNMEEVLFDRLNHQQIDATLSLNEQERSSLICNIEVNSDGKRYPILCKYLSGETIDNKYSSVGIWKAISLLEDIVSSNNDIDTGWVVIMCQTNYYSSLTGPRGFSYGAHAPRFIPQPEGSAIYIHGIYMFDWAKTKDGKSFCIVPVLKIGE